MKKLAVAMVFLVILISGCTTSQTGTTTTTTEEGVKEFDVLVGHNSYYPSTFVVSVGDTVRFIAVAAPGTSTHMHGITIDEYGINQVVTTEDPENPVVIEFTADKSGEFGIYCKTCFTGPYGVNHPNIQGTLIVTD